VSALPRPPHVAFLTGEYPPTRGGVGDYTSCLARALAQQAVRCSVITSYVPGARRAPPSPFDPRVCPAIRSWSWSSWGHLRALLRDLQPDVLHVQYQTGAFGMHPSVNLLPLWLRAAGFDRPIAVTFHDLKAPYLFPKAGRLRHLTNAVLARTADAVVVTNPEDVAAADPARLWEIPIGSNIDPVALAPGERSDARTRLGLGDGDHAIGYFGFVNEWKGVDTLVEAFARVLERRADTRLVFVGGSRREGAAASFGFEGDIRRRLRDEPFRANVVWTGFDEPREISAFLQALDVIALPFVEGASYRHGTLAAAIAHGLPIVTTTPVRGRPTRSASSLPRLVDGENSRLVPPNDPTALAGALTELLDRPDLRRRIGAGAAALAPRFGWHAIAAESRRMYDSLLGATGQPAPTRPLAAPR
jgi:glycosyltransferase involved in cell wall biosynthesis